jgi:hypothetical protein
VRKGGGLFAHNVFFTLRDRSEEARKKLVSACYSCLEDHPGVLSFAAGTRAEEYVRDVNDANFDVSSHMLFRSKEDHDRYQNAPEHNRFVQENSGNWARVRVFDSYVGK